MPFISNADVASLIRDVSAAYQVKERKDSRTKYRVTKLEEMANIIMNLDVDLYMVYDKQKIPGIGQRTVEYLNELFKTGNVGHWNEVKKGLPPLFFELSRVLTPLQAMSILEHYPDAKTISDVRKLDLSKVFGKKKIAESIMTDLMSDQPRIKLFLLSQMIYLSNQFVDYINTEKHITRLQIAGSIRRRKAVIKDIDIVIESSDIKKTRGYILKYDGITERINEGGENWLMLKIRYRAYNVPVDVRLVSKESNEYISLLHHLTGSKFHNIHLREMAKKKGLKISEHGIEDSDGKVFKAQSEKEFFEYLGLQYIPPELREDSGIELKLEIPNRLIEFKDIKGDLHIHSSFNINSSHDYGTSTIDELAERAVELGYEYISISDHNPKQTLSSDEMIKLLRDRQKLIKEAESKYGIRIFSSLEIDIKSDGMLAVGDEVLDELDFAIVSIHSSFDLDMKSQTQRILKALNHHPKVKILGHPLTRILPDMRGDISVDWDRVFSHCAKNSKYIEINAEPSRCDLPFDLVFKGLGHGVKYVINSDTHDIKQMNNMIYGQFNALRGWCTREDVVNANGLNKFERLMVK